MTLIFSNFIELFEFVQIKTYSEAICETIGSMMNIHNGRGRNLHPLNFAKELYLNFNLGPLHLLKKSFIPAIVNEKFVEEKKKYLRLTTKKYKLKIECCSASIGNFRVKEEKKSHLPVSWFR